MPQDRSGADRVGVAALPLPPRPAPAARLGRSYLVAAAVLLVAGSAARVPAGPVLAMIAIMAANAFLLAGALRRRPATALVAGS